LELHEAARADSGKQIVKVQGPGRTAVPMKGLEHPTSSVLGYWWVSYHVGLNSFTGRNRDSQLVVLDNVAFRETKWFRGGADGLTEHWAYRAKAFLPTADRNEIEWTPGVPQFRARQVSATELEVTLHSVTPNLKAYAVRVNGAPEQLVADQRFRWRLAPGANTLQVRTHNRFDIRGPAVTARVLVGDKQIPLPRQ
jgi:hypothetical protein